MKNAQAKIDALLDLLVENLQARMFTHSDNVEARDGHLKELERLIGLANLNNRRREVIDKPSPQGQSTTMSNEQLVAELTAARDPDLFPRRGPRKGKRENPGKPIPIPPPRDVVTCAIHEGVVCAVTRTEGLPDSVVCPDCAKEVPIEGFVSLKSLL